MPSFNKMIILTAGFLAVFCIQASPSDIENYLVKTYKISEDAAFEYVSIAFDQEIMDPVLLLAIAAKESSMRSCATNPNGTATGLTQVIARYHGDKIEQIAGKNASRQALFDPRTSLMVGALIYKEAREKTNDRTSALMAYTIGFTGWKRDPSNISASQYAESVLHIYNKIKACISE
jgi:soluble lytic murein transglycosylase-like protein